MPIGKRKFLRCGKHEREIYAAVPETTNNQMELMAAIKGLEELTEACVVRVVTDSQYVFRGMTQWIAGWQESGWKTSKRKPVRNRELWERLLALAERHEVEWEWVRGHDGHEENERCDRLANRAMDEYSGAE